MNITIIGAGAWGTALAVSLAARHRVTLWARDAEQLAAMRARRCNQRYLPSVTLPDNLLLSADFPAALTGADLLVVAVPTAAFRSTLHTIVQSGLCVSACSVVWLCKGFEAGTALLPHQIAGQVLPHGFQCGVLSGPSFALEVAQGLPTALVLAASDEAFAQRIAHALHHSRLRVYASNDVVGVEVGGAVKNVMAIAAGVCDGMKLGNNARAALITRGLAEITRLGLKLGGHQETLGGLSGAGDLILTCTGDLSRNRRVGLLLAQQQGLDEILLQLGHVAEGVYAVREVHQLAQRLGVDMPISDAVYRVLYEHIPAAEMVATLLNRTASLEFSQS
ncbi:MAG: NAD(P)H-dependent glycerol-3-phosphate dehydrogenase [Gallionella sp.]|nr:NAD(P)H-dependent glycerol-3-phosphate dehydrogenase [Gallionella sp.]